MFVLGAVPKVFIERTARNILSTEYCLSPVEALYCLYLGQFVFDSCGSITYTLVTTSYRYRGHLSTRYSNCKLFKNDKSCCSFDDTNKPLNDTEAILHDPERQRYIHINTAVVIISTQFLTILHGHMTDKSWRESKMCTTKEAK